MKKKHRIMYIFIIAVMSVGILASTLFVCYKLQCGEAEQIIKNAEHVIKTKENPVSVMQESLNAGVDPIKAFYLGYDFENPGKYWDAPAYGFHSELRNEAGEVLAEYEPFLVLKGKTADNKDDYRIIVFDEYTLVSEYSDGEKCDWGSNKYPFECMSLCSQAVEADGFEYILGKPLEIYGTCDDTFVYVEKMVWSENVEEDLVATYIYTPVNDKTDMGKEPVENWINGLTDKKFIMQTENLPYIYIEDEEIHEEASILCKNLSSDYLEAGCDSEKLVSKNHNNLKTYTIEKVEALGDGYFVSSVFVIHPLQMVSDDVAIPYIIFIIFIIVFIAVIAIVIIRKVEKGYIFNISEEKEKRIIKYVIGLAISVTGLVLLPLLVEITPLGKMNGLDMLFLIGYFVVVASFIIGAFDIKYVFKFTYPIINAILFFVSWAVAPIWDREWAILPGYTAVYAAVSVVGVLLGLLSGLLFRRVKKTIKKR